MKSRRDGAAKVFISGHTPQKVGTKLTLGLFHSTTLTRLT